MKYLATFYTHYGAISFHKSCKKSGIVSKMSPVPRSLSSSCGVCVYFDADSVPTSSEHEDLERYYEVLADDSFAPLGG